MVRWSSAIAATLARGATSRLPRAGAHAATSSAASQPPGSLPWTPPSTSSVGPSVPLCVTTSGVSHSVPPISPTSSRPRGGGGAGVGVGVAVGVGSAAAVGAGVGVGVGVEAASRVAASGAAGRAASGGGAVRAHAASSAAAPAAPRLSASRRDRSR